MTVKRAFVRTVKDSEFWGSLLWCEVYLFLLLLLLIGPPALRPPIVLVTILSPLIFLGLQVVSEKGTQAYFDERCAELGLPRMVYDKDSEQPL